MTGSILCYGHDTIRVGVVLSDRLDKLGIGRLGIGIRLAIGIGPGELKRGSGGKDFGLRTGRMFIAVGNDPAELTVGLFHRTFFFFHFVR